jgi:pyruvate dehydrogenase E1 component alpha subunit
VLLRAGGFGIGPLARRARPAPPEVQARWKEEPIARLRTYLVSQKAWGKSEEEQLSAECQQRIEAAIERYLAVGSRAPETMFDNLYAELPNAYIGQRDELKGPSHA